MTHPVIVDTTVWCNFAVARHPRLVLDVFPRSSSPRPVLEEIEEGRRRGYFPDFDLSWLSEVEMTLQEQALAHQLAEKLDRGEGGLPHGTSLKRVPMADTPSAEGAQEWSLGDGETPPLPGKP